MLCLLLQSITKDHILSLTISFRILVLIKAWLFGKSLYIVIPIPVGGPTMKTKCPSSFSMVSAVSWAHFHGSWSGWEAIPVSVSGANIVSPTPQWVCLRKRQNKYYIFLNNGSLANNSAKYTFRIVFTFKYLLNANTISIWWRLSRLVITSTFFALMRPDSSNLKIQWSIICVMVCDNW